MTNNNHYEGGYAPAFMKSRENLCKLVPQSITEGSQCHFSNGRFTIESFGRTIEISYPEGQIISQGPNISFDARLLLLNYLSYAKNVPFSGQWVSYRDLPHGNVFYPNIKKNVIDPLGGFFANCDKDILRHSLIEAGFTLLLGKADIAAKGFFAPRIPILLHFWEGEEDIPSTCQILFDSTIRDQMHIEDSAALCGIIKNQVLSQYTLALEEARRGYKMININD
ncbi:DUF3786 domain-containing protein [Desulfosporosinus burensis]